MKIEHAILGAERFTKDELRQISLELYQRDLENREYAVRYARLLKDVLALRNPNLKTVADIAAGLARAELQLDDDQRVCEIEPGQHRDKRGFACISPGDHRFFLRFDGACACMIATAALHECRHRYQVISRQFIRMYGNAESEPDADGFAAEIMRKYHFVCGGCRKSY